jgi:hypothetical protein
VTEGAPVSKAVTLVMAETSGRLTLAGRVAPPLAMATTTAMVTATAAAPP